MSNSSIGHHNLFHNQRLLRPVSLEHQSKLKSFGIVANSLFKAARRPSSFYRNDLKLRRSESGIGGSRRSVIFTPRAVLSMEPSFEVICYNNNKKINSYFVPLNSNWFCVGWILCYAQCSFWSSGYWEVLTNYFRAAACRKIQPWWKYSNAGSYSQLCMTGAKLWYFCWLLQMWYRFLSSNWAGFC